VADAFLTLAQRRAIHGADTWLEQAGLPTYTDVLGALEKHTRPAAALPAGQTVTLDGPVYFTPSLDEVLRLTLPPDLVAALVPVQHLPSDDTEGGAA
jgi:hypothetical protein